jgi:hypothetical protein
MANADLKVKISGDLAEIRSALVQLQSQLKGVGKTGAAAGSEASAGFDKLGSKLTGLVGTYLSFRSAIAIFQAVVRNTVEAERAQAQLRAALESSKGAAKLTADELNRMAESLQAVSKFDDDAITGAQVLLLQFDKIGRDVFPRATQAVLDFAERMGVDLDEAAKKVGKALQDPEKGLRALRDAGVKLSDDQVELIEQLVKVGDAASAQRLILDELEKKMGGAAAASRDTLGGALQGLENDFGNLLEGKSGGDGVRGATDAVNEFAKTLRSPGASEGFSAFTSGLLSIITLAGKVATEVARMAKVVGTTFAFIGTEIGHLIDMQKAGFTLDIEGWKKARSAFLSEYSNFEKELDKVRNPKAATRTNTPRGEKVAPAPAFVTMPEMRIDASEATAAASEAKRKIEALRREHEKLREEAERAEAARKKELDELNERIAKGMREVEIALQRASGDEAGAAFKEIDDRYAELIADLKTKGDAASQEIVERLISQDKFQAQLDALAAKADAAMRSFAATAATSEGAVGEGELSRDDADARIEQSRQAQLATLRKLRQEALAYYRTHSGPEAQAALEAVGQFDGQIRQLEDAHQTFREFAKDQAAQALTNFFTDLATGAKSFKDAFLDMLRSFLAGIAQMIAQKLALKAVDAIFSMFHSGGIAGAGGTLRQGVNPMVFGFAPRYHSGGIAGLGPNEVPAILQRGEEVLTQRDARHRANGGGQDRSRVKTPVVAFGDRAVADALAGLAGEDVVVTHVVNNLDRILAGRK